ncbi:hypothetical protein ALT_9082 [Aspergillus lentulus]|uniref:Secreted protein n=1 Tax=Aspergillus lentulus TaxID=293939 RepID=A0AAN4PS71_ASPLE|nr:hypothetical protein ALT_9082 [Aspergillus lentulus]
MRLLSTISISLPLLLLTSVYADPRACTGDTKVLNPSYFTLNETDNRFLPALSKIFTDVGKKVTVTQVLADANRDLQKGTAAFPMSERWLWNSGDESTTKWIPQGMTSSGDALAVGTYEGKDVWLASWYQKEGDANVRVSFVDRATHKYRHVMLVEPSAADNFKSVPIHAGGIAWYGNALYVVDTDHGLRVFDMDNIWKVESGDGIGKMAGGGYSAANYAYVLPQTRVYNWTELQPDSKFRHSWVALDRLDSPDTLLIGEYQTDDTSTPIRLVKYPLDYTTRRLRKTGSTVATASWAYCVNILRMQGGFSRNDTFYLGRSNGENNGGDLFTWTPGEAAVGSSYFPPGNEDLSYNEAKKEWYSVTEWQNQRYILAYKKEIP